MKNNHILWLGLILSVLLKGFFLSLDGNADMLQYRMWGDAVLDKGLADAYRGIYFPLQWQLFAICSWLARNFNFLHWTLPFKAMNLIFDIGCFWVLVLLLKRHKLNPLYALLYCLHPWFIVNFSQGFVDSQSMFFVLLPLLILRENGNTFKRYFAAGIPLACAFLMKPQIMLIIAAIGVLSGLGMVQNALLATVRDYYPGDRTLCRLHDLFFIFCSRIHSRTKYHHSRISPSPIYLCRDWHDFPLSDGIDVQHVVSYRVLLETARRPRL